MASPNASARRSDQWRYPLDHAETVKQLDPWIDALPDVYFAEFLKTVSVATSALAGQIWGLNPSGRLIKISSTDETRFKHFEHPDVASQHKKLIREALFDGQLTSKPFSEREGRAMVSRILVLAPFYLQQESIGVVELMLASEMKDECLPLLKDLLTHASIYLSKRTSPSSTTQTTRATDQLQTTNSRTDKYVFEKPESQETVTSSAELPSEELPRILPANKTLSAEDVEHFIWLLHQDVDLKYAASTSVNETRRLLNCDRVGLAIWRGATTELIAISGQDSIVGKSNSVRAVKRLADQVVLSGQSIQYDFDDPNPAHTQESLVDYLTETSALRLKVIPLSVPEKIDFEVENVNREPRIFAALIIEQFSDEPGPAVFDIQRLVPHIAQSTFHALNQQQIFLLPARRCLGRWMEKLKTGKTKAYIAVASLALMAVLLVMVKIPYQVQATGKLMPAQQFRAYAPFDGEVKDIFVDSGQSVDINQPLLNLYDESLETRLLISTNSIEEKRKLLAAYKAQLDDDTFRVSQAEKIELSAKIAQHSVEIEGLRQQLVSLQRLAAQSVVRSNISGTVATFRPEDLLAGRPVSRGQLLVEIMNAQGPWNLELKLPAKRFGQLLQGNDDDPSRRMVTFVQATAPEMTYRGVIRQISTRTQTESDGSSVILILASIDENQDMRRTIGAEVIAKISCGKKSLGYACFGDVFDWVRRKIW